MILSFVAIYRLECDKTYNYAGLLILVSIYKCTLVGVRLGGWMHRPCSVMPRLKRGPVCCLYDLTIAQLEQLALLSSDYFRYPNHDILLYALHAVVKLEISVRRSGLELKWSFRTAQSNVLYAQI